MNGPQLVISTHDAQPESRKESQYEKWLQTDMRRCEIAHYIKKALELISGSFSYQRQKGLDQLLDLLSQISQNPHDQNIFSLIHRQMSPSTNIIVGIVNCILKEHKGHHHLSPVRISELKKSLIVIEGSCLISPYCSSALATIQGNKVIVKILSEGPHTSIGNENSHPILDSLSPTLTGTVQLAPTGSQSSTDMSWEEIRFLAIDTLEVSLHNSVASGILFCEDSGPDMIMEMVRNKHLSTKMRSKCVEIICLLLQLLYVAEKRKNDDTLIQALVERIVVFLGQKLTEELRELALKPIRGNDSLSSLQLIDTKTYDLFIKRVDQRL
jgi:hypothetical protein